MPPTITSSNGTDKRINQPERASERRSELICRVKYGNTLPDIPFDLKFLQYPFDSHRFVKYNPTSLERNYKYDVLTEHDLGVTIDLINRDLYQADPNAALHPADEKLLEEDVHAPQDSMRSRQHSRSVSWLRKSEYISTEQTRFQPQNLENIEAKVGYNVKKSLREQTLYLDRDAQIKAIEKTFSDAKKEINKHYSKPNVTPVEVLSVYPDFENWKFPCAQVIFDTDPAPIGKNVPAQIEEMSQAMIRGVMDESGEQFVAYFLPTEETLEKRRVDVADNILYRDGEEYDYKIAREYNWNVKSKASKGYEENYFFVIRGEGVYYNELETRVRLNKRRIRVGQQTSNTILAIKHRPLDANEHRVQRYREKQLDPAGEDDDEDEIDPEETEVLDKTRENKSDDEQTTRDREMRSRSRSARSSRSRSQSVSPRTSRSRSESGSRSRSGSRSGSRSVSRSRSRSKSRSHSPKTRSRSNTQSRSRSKSHSRSVSKTHSRSHSKTRSRSRSKTRSRSRSSLVSNEGSDYSRESSKSRSRSPSHHSGSESNDESDHPQESPKHGSNSERGSHSPSPSKEHSVSPAVKPGSRPQSQSRSPSPSSSHSSPAASPNSHSGSDSNSASDEEN